MTKKVYLIRAAQFYKIGISGNVSKRLASIQTGCPIKCEYIGYLPTNEPESLERHLHLQLQDFKTNGEWFDLGDDIIRMLITEYNLKHTINPYQTITNETQRTSGSSALVDARKLTSDSKQIEIVYESLYPGMELSDIGIRLLRKLMLSYGFEAVSESMRHLASKIDSDKMFDKIKYASANYAKYGRNIDDKVWRLYYFIKENDSASRAGVDLDEIMLSGIDQSEFWDDYVDAKKSEYV